MDFRNNLNVELISNSSMDVYPQNVISEFTTKLAQPLELTGQWEVGLVNCHYHRNWLNLLPKDKANFAFKIGTWRETGEVRWIAAVTTDVPSPGNYANVQSLIDAILNTTIKYHRKKDNKAFDFLVKDFIDITFSNVTQKVTVSWKRHSEIKNDLCMLKLSEKLIYFLGHNVMERPAGIQKKNPYIVVGNVEWVDPEGESFWPLLPWRKTRAISTYTCNDPANMVDVYNLFIYTDLVESTRLGDADASYLYMLPVQGTEGDYINFEPNEVSYKRVNKQSVSTIHIKVADILGKRVKFNHGSGEFTILLNFRKIAS